MSALPSTQEPEVNFCLLPITVIARDDDTNGRSSYPRELMDDLKASIKEHGVLQNLAVGPENENGEYPLVWGFRRHKATEELLNELEAEDTDEATERRKLLFQLPVKILTAAEYLKAKELQLIENLQRENVDPVDEARGYRELLDKRDANGQPIYTIERLAITLGIPRKGMDYIRLRLKLLNAPDFLLDAIRSGVVQSVRVGELIGRLTNAAQREQAAKWAIADRYTGKPMSTRAVIDMIKEFSVPLRGCEFDLDAVDLLTDAEKVEMGFTAPVGEIGDGSCRNCPLRSENDPTAKELLRDAGTGSGSTEGLDPLICQNPKCFEKKQAAAWRVIEKHAEESGMRVMNKETAKELYNDGYLSKEGQKKYIERYARPDYSCTGHMAEETMPTWDDLLSPEGVSWLIIRAPNKKIFHILEKDTAISTVERACERDGKDNPFQNRPKKQSDVIMIAAAPAHSVAQLELEVEEEEVSDETSEEREKREAEEALERSVKDKRVNDEYKFNRMLLGMLVDKLRPSQLDGEAWRSLILSQIHEGAADPDFIGAALGHWTDPITPGPTDWAEIHNRKQMLIASVQAMPLDANRGFALYLICQASQLLADYRDGQGIPAYLSKLCGIDHEALWNKVVYHQESDPELPLPTEKPLKTKDELVSSIIKNAESVGYADEDSCRGWIVTLQDEAGWGARDRHDFLDTKRVEWSYINEVHELVLADLERPKWDEQLCRVKKEPDLFTDTASVHEFAQKLTDEIAAGIGIPTDMLNEPVDAGPSARIGADQSKKVSKKTVSQEARLKLVEAQKRVWASRAAKKTGKKATKKTAKKAVKKAVKKRELSPETKQRIHEAQAKRWAQLDEANAKKKAAQKKVTKKKK